MPQIASRMIKVSACVVLGVIAVLLSRDAHGEHASLHEQCRTDAGVFVWCELYTAVHKIILYLMSIFMCMMHHPMYYFFLICVLCVCGVFAHTFMQDRR